MLLYALLFFRVESSGAKPAKGLSPSLHHLVPLHSTMGRTKSKSKKPSRVDNAPAAPVVELPPPTAEELLVQSAQLIASLQYEEAKAVCLQALELAVEKEDTMLCTDSLEILGTVELELGLLDQAREVSFLSLSEGRRE